MEKQTDENFAEMAAKVAEQIVRDYAGLTIGTNPESTHQFMTNQLEARIASALRAFHHREGHYEIDAGSTPAPAPSFLETNNEGPRVV